ncbi:cytochrome P450 [Nocardia ninae]|uniref:Cytochrome P450 n=1 Tax=Nocardia ninae NBRC 108245 TaxID=1210091 RepID=A0A511MEN9_9NOCA|nr:cytochrome P450 [Nocardia ninae]GEM39112.1 cytochrome P450 [Nocardia ninae NBRC 108245]
MKSIASIPMARGRLPLMGHLLPLVRDPLGFLSSLPAQGELVRFELGPLEAILVCDRELVQHVLRHDRIFDKDGGTLFEQGRRALGDGLVTCPHSRHRRQRRMLQPAFHRSRLPAYAASISAQIDAITSAWQSEQDLDILMETRKFAANATATVVFSGAVPESTAAQTIDDIDAIFAGVFRRSLVPQLLTRLPTPGNRAYQRSITRLRGTLGDLVAARRHADVDHGDLLSALLDARDTDGKGLSDTEISDQMITFLNAGTHTTADALTWALYELDRHPDIARRLHAEVDGVLAGRAATYDDLPHLPLTGHFITETLRLRGPAWLLTRHVTEDTELGGCRLPKGTVVAYSSYLVGHCPAVYAEPDRFDPDRWDTTTPPPQNALIPFGGGARKCIGDLLALDEAAIALATIAARWRLRALPGNDMRPALAVTLHPRRLHMRAEIRTPATSPTSAATN